MTEAAIGIGALSASAEEAGADAFVVDLDGYEGPLHLLLDLARRQKVDLRQISILTLAEQYLNFIEAAKKRRIDLAADYLLMASWLALLKSRLMLPKPQAEESEEDDAGDSAERLAFRLKRLDAMREAGEALMSGPLLDNVVFLRGAPEKPTVVKTSKYSTTLWHLTQAFGLIRDRKTKEAPHRIEQQFVLPLETARNGLRAISKDIKTWESLDTLRRRLPDIDSDVPTASVTASVFTAVLELVRDGDVDMRQDRHFAPLYLKQAVSTSEARHD